jgi:hypothetical protein
MGLNGKLQERLGIIIGTLVVAFVLGGITLVVTQAIANENIENLEEQQKINSAAARALPVIQNDLGYIKDALRDIKKHMDKVSEADNEYHHKHGR